MRIDSVSVFCGSSPGARPEYTAVARRLGIVLAREGIVVVYGGARIGMMGELARGALSGGGEIIGVVPRDLASAEVAFTDLPDLRIVDTMHERKALMYDLSDAFIGLPGGLGTIEEFFEAATWAQLGLHNKPCGLLNICGFFDPLMEFLDRAARERFLDSAHRSLVLVDHDPEGLLRQFEVYAPPRLDKAAWALGLSC
jgi:uncharacterized protein (TIGR00730 family)